MSLSIIIPTAGRATLTRAVQSVLSQSGPDDELIVAIDTHGGAPAVERMPGVRYVEHDAGAHDWGHSQINAAMAVACGSYILVNDDDDIYTPGAFDAVRGAIARQLIPRPLLFRHQAYNGLTYWLKKDWVCEGAIGGHSLVAPNDSARLGQWTDRYAGDFDAITGTLRYYDGAADWERPIIAYARPPYGWRAVETDADVEALRQLRNAGHEWLRDTHEIGEYEQRAWWLTRDTARLRAYLITDDAGETVGAGVLSLRADRWWITVLVTPDRRGQGIGTFVYRLLICASPGDVWAEIREDNDLSRRAATAAGYQLAEQHDGLLLMRGAL